MQYLVWLLSLSYINFNRENLSKALKNTSYVSFNSYWKINKLSNLTKLFSHVLNNYLVENLKLTKNILNYYWLMIYVLFMLSIMVVTPTHYVNLHTYNKMLYACIVMYNLSTILSHNILFQVFFILIFL